MNFREVLLSALASVLLLFLLKSWKSELSPLVRASILLSLFGLSLLRLSPLFASLTAIAERYSIEGFSLLWRGAGISLAATLASGLCREIGEGGIADGLEFFGKAELLLLSLPALSDLLGLAGSLLDLGGIS